MKIVGISASGRRDGNTSRLVRYIMNKMSEYGAESEMIETADMDLRFCTACENCMRKGFCVIDDGYRQAMEKIKAADGIILGSPNYSFNMSAQMKTLFDRSHMLLYYMRALKGKYGIGVSVGGHPYRTDLVAKMLSQGAWLCGGYTVGRICAVSRDRDDREFLDAEKVYANADALALRFYKAINGKKRYFFQDMLRKFTLEPALRKMVMSKKEKYPFLYDFYGKL